jgi:uncharacterized protein
MSAEENKVLVLRACQLISDRNITALAELIHEDGSWSIPYRTDMFPYAGQKNKEAECAMLRQFLGGFDKFFFSVTSVVAEGDRVAAEVQSKGTGPGTAEYANIYHMIFIIKDQKIHTVREYLDPFQVTAYVAQMQR